MIFKQLREKSVKGFGISRYLENPSPRELVQFTKNLKHQEVRLVYVNQILYGFDAEIYTHIEFMMKELFMDYSDALTHYNKSPEYSGSFSLVGDSDYYLYGLKGSFGRSKYHEKFKENLKKYWDGNKSITEKFQKGFKIRHLMDPSPRETVQFMKKTKYNSIRAYIAKDKKIYVWDANDAIHEDFIVNELFEDKYYSIQDTANFDIFYNTEGTILGGSFLNGKYDRWTDDVMDEIAEVYDGHFIDDEYSSLEEYIFVPNKNAK